MSTELTDAEIDKMNEILEDEGIDTDMLYEILPHKCKLSGNEVIIVLYPCSLQELPSESGEYDDEDPDALEKMDQQWQEDEVFDYCIIDRKKMQTLVFSYNWFGKDYTLEIATDEADNQH